MKNGFHLITRAATLDNLFSPMTGTEIPYFPLQHNMQFSPMFPYVPLQISYFPYKYCIFVWKIHCRAAKFGCFKSWRLFAHLVQKKFFRREFFLTTSPPPPPPPPPPATPPRRQKNFGLCTILGVEIYAISHKIVIICPIFLYNKTILPDCGANIARLALFAQQTGWSGANPCIEAVKYWNLWKDWFG
jgi:hypothetical protein